MKRLLFSLLALIAPAMAGAADVARLSPTDAAQLVAAGRAVLVDVREPAEWKQSGVAAPAVLLSKSDFDHGAQAWADFLAQHRGQEIILYCRSGHRAGVVAAALAQQGFHVANAGGLRDWIAAGLPARPMDAPAPPVVPAAKPAAP